MAEVIIAATALDGHVAPMLCIGSDLINRGHDVTVLTGSRFRSAVEDMGARFAPLSGCADIDPMLFRSPARPSLSELDQLNWDFQNFAVGTVKDQWSSLQKVLGDVSTEDAVVLSESGFWGVAPGLAGAPGVRPRRYVVVGIDPLSVSSRDLAPFGSGAGPTTTPTGRERYAKANEYSRTVLFAETQHIFEAIMEETGVTTDIPFFLDCLALLAETYLQLSIPEISYERSDLPGAISFVGALPSRPVPDAVLPDWWQDVLDAHIVVVVSQGTVFNRDLTELIQPTLEALADLPVLVVATTGSKERVENVPANARVAEYIPFADLLPLASVLVTNGGYDGVQQALSFRVPMVLAGDTEDRIEGNARIAYTGAAINLKTQRPTVGEIREAVSRVLEQAAFGRAARALADTYRSAHPYEAISQAVSGSV